MKIKFEKEFEVSCRFLIKNYIDLVEKSVMKKVEHSKLVSGEDSRIVLPLVFISHGTSGSNFHDDYVKIEDPPWEQIQQKVRFPVRRLISTNVFDIIHESISIDLAEHRIEQIQQNQLPIGNVVPNFNSDVFTPSVITESFLRNS